MIEDFKVHIYPSDCDSVGHVNHAHLLTILERARWSRSLVTSGPLEYAPDRTGASRL